MYLLSEKHTLGTMSSDLGFVPEDTRRVANDRRLVFDEELGVVGSAQFLSSTWSRPLAKIVARFLK